MEKGVKQINHDYCLQKPSEMTNDVCIHQSGFA